MAEDDFGFSQIDWDSANEGNLQLVLAEYQSRYENTVANYEATESKGRWQFAIIWPFSTGLTAYLIANWEQLNPCNSSVLSMLTCIMWVGVVLVYFSLYSREYISDGVTPKGMDLSKWEKPITDGSQKNRLIGIKIRHLAFAIKSNGVSNLQKSKWLERATLVNLAALPLTALIFLVCHVFIDPFAFMTICPLTP